MGEANLCLKITFLIIQFLFVACGLALIGVGIYLEVVDQFIVQAIQNSAFLAGPYLLIAVGVAILLVAVVGVIGGACSKKFNRVILVLYIVIVFFIFIAEIAGGVIAFVFRSEAEAFVVQSLNTAIGQFYNNETTTGDAVTRAVDVLQQQLDCCGLGDNGTFSIEAFWMDNNNGVIPSSCCTTFDMNVPCLPNARPELEARIARLKLEQEEREYQKMVENVSPEKRITEQLQLGIDMKTTQIQMTVVLNFIVTVLGGFVFGYFAGHWLLGWQFTASMILATCVATLIFYADLYFIVKTPHYLEMKLESNDQLNVKKRP